MRPLRCSLVLLLVLTLTACTSGDTMPTPPEKTGDDRVRTDLEPLAKRLPRLSSAESAAWMSGTMGSAPGPSTYWIDAVVVLDAATLAAASEVPGLGPADAPEVAAGLRPSIPEGELQRSEALDDYFRTQQWQVDAWLAPEQGQVVLSIIGQ